MKYKLGAALVLILLAVIFIVQNAAIVNVQLIFWTISISRIVLMLIILIIGIIVGFLMNSYLRHLKSVR